jgi:hypothetical protein
MKFKIYDQDNNPVNCTYLIIDGVLYKKEYLHKVLWPDYFFQYTNAETYETAVNDWFKQRHHTSKNPLTNIQSRNIIHPRHDILW